MTAHRWAAAASGVEADGDPEPAGISDDDIDRDCDARFRCHNCVILIAEGSAVYMRRDSSYCSPECRRKGRSGQFTAFRDMTPADKRAFIHRPSGSHGTLSSYLSDTVSSASSTASRERGGGPSEWLLKKALGWVIGKVAAASAASGALALASSSFGSLGSFRNSFERIAGALPSVGSRLGNTGHQQENSESPSFGGEPFTLDDTS